MTYRCRECGYQSVKWLGFCPQCRSQDALEEVSATRRDVPEIVDVRTAVGTVRARTPIGIDEIDRVVGGGIVPGSTTLVGGEPGVGKSTLLLQLAGAFAAAGGRVLVASAEESVEQVGLRARRVGISSETVALVGDSDIDAILAAADTARPDLLIVDSIQTVIASDLGATAGTVSQVRECAARVIGYSKKMSTASIIVGHVTKDGGIAGPKTLEHMVDVVLYLEGENSMGLRVLRGLKNRFGPTHNMGLFEMRGDGLMEVEDPSSALLSEWRCCVPVCRREATGTRRGSGFGGAGTGTPAATVGPGSATRAGSSASRSHAAARGRRARRQRGIRQRCRRSPHLRTSHRSAGCARACILDVRRSTRFDGIVG